MADRSPAEPMDVRILAPAPDLASTVEACWFVPRGGGPGTSFHAFLPDAASNLIFRFDGDDCRMVLLGPVTEKATVELARDAEYFGVRFRPGQAPGLVDAAPGELVDGKAEIERIGGVPVESLAERLFALPDLVARRQLLESLLRQGRPHVRDERCRRACLAVEAHGGRLRIEELAGRMGVHVRSLERLFRTELGVSPKKLGRLVRLRRLLVHLRAGAFESLADLALDLGYADQAHMTRDFKELTGGTPADRAPAGAMQDAPATRVVHRVRR